MIINSLDKQIVLAENGEILWQKDLTDPRPGEPIAQIVKGASLQTPDCKLIESDILGDQDRDAVLGFTKAWLDRHLKTVLEPLFKLQDDDIATGAPQEIAHKLFDALGIVSRDEISNLINAMLEEGRATLRTKKIRFGPIIVYLPELNKPAMVRLRALLLSLWEEKELPATVPADGIVSQPIDDAAIDTRYYMAIGYPVYGPRACRVDMLDRVICAVYDAADKGKFNAQHQMAEWLGCSIPELYKILEAMGHRKIFDPAEEAEKLEAEKPVETTEEATAPEDSAEEKPAEEAKVTPASEGEKKPMVQVKPELATFILKKGKAAQGGNYQAGNNNAASAKSSAHKNASGNFSSSKRKKKSHDKKPKNTGARVYKAEAKEADPSDNPFAILEQLKSAKKD